MLSRGRVASATTVVESPIWSTLPADPAALSRLAVMTVISPYELKLGRIPVREGSVTVLGSETRYWDYGDENSPVTIVMVHGFRGDHHGLEPIVAQLDGVRCILPDLPGFGSSEPLQGRAHDIDGYADWLRGFAALFATGGRHVILGHSFGSIVVAATVADSSAEPVLKPDDIILVNPIAAPALSGPRGVLTRLAVFYYWASARLPERVGFAFLRNRAIVRGTSVAMVKTHDPALRRWIHDQHDQYFSAFADRSVVLEAFRASVSNDVSEFAASIAEPVLLIAAERDDITSVEAEEKLATIFPDATLRVIPSVGHLIHYEEPAEAARLLTEFLDAGRIS